MKWTKMMIQTLREDPGDAEIDSHKLLVRAALVKKTAAGLFTFLPLGMRALRKVEAIVREEMDRAGAQELLMPILQPAELWQTTGRWETMGANMFKLKDRAQHDFALGPTAEEEVTDVVKSVVSSYRQLPVIVYQIQTKFRDETRPRFGLMRSKEFIMKDAYSCDVDAAGADESYWTMYRAYERIFARCGLKATPVQADGGDMGDSMTHEFHALADAGEDGIASCPACGYAANLERAERKLTGGSRSCATAADAQERVPPAEDADATSCVPPAEAVPTPNARTIEEVAAFFGLPPSAFVKTLVYVADGKPVMVCVPGDRDVNEVKLKRFLKAKAVALADARTVEEVTGAPVGFAGPVKPAKAEVPVYAESALEGASGVVVGANQADTHLKNVDLARDAKITAYADLVICGAGDLCPKCGKPMELKRGIEVGQVFKLGARHEVHGRVQGRVQERPAQGERDDHGLLRRGREPHDAGRGGAEPRQGRHHLACERGAVPGGARPPRPRQRRRREGRRRPRDAAGGGGHRRARGRPCGASGREVQGRRPHRLPRARGGGREGPRQWRRGGEAPRPAEGGDGQGGPRRGACGHPVGPCPVSLGTPFRHFSPVSCM